MILLESVFKDFLKEEKISSSEKEEFHLQVKSLHPKPKLPFISDAGFDANLDGES